MTFYIFLLACCAAGATGIIFKPGAWYESLQKPSFTPPNWAFPMAWTTIYLLLAWAGYRLTLLPGSETVLAPWAAEIALNTFWTPVFFGANRIGADGDFCSSLDCSGRDGCDRFAAGHRHRPYFIPLPDMALGGCRAEFLYPAPQ
jgi:hypothetical protein